ncbi:hypothetical protein [Metabacillus halosaccharovorans]|uniref:Uncharacterized protein n=1 Tax=Metabacillus halosaccharovorans TaxID=930124 RepID=A0ABT3DPF2_9BACI|nr:hypothetical protein [Metabacillus halosaccharovorans]MCV9888773.1 hypothetical protein [Metabacillus halosaccharovorans]
MKAIYTLELLVIEFGNDKQKESLIKNNGNLNKRTFDSLITTVKQHYDYVLVEGKGKKRMITCKGKRTEVLDRKELQNYSNSGNREQLTYKEDIRTATIQYLNRHKADTRPTITTKRLAYELGCLVKSCTKHPEK